jgi:hypothetical protein
MKVNCTFRLLFKVSSVMLRSKKLEIRKKIENCEKSRKNVKTVKEQIKKRIDIILLFLRFLLELYKLWFQSGDLVELCPTLSNRVNSDMENLD